MSLSRNIIIFSTADWDNPFWTNKQHMAETFAKKGFRILYVDSLGLRRPAVSKKDFGRIKTRIVNGFKGLRRVDDNIWVYSPFVIPMHKNYFIRKFNNKIIGGALTFYKKTLNFKNPIIWTYNPLVGEIIKRLKPSLVVYHCVDDLASAPLMPSKIIKEEEMELIKSADFIFTSSPGLQEYCAGINPSSSFYFPNVADFEHFSKSRQSGAVPDDIKNIPHPRIGFIGAISAYKLDFELIRYVAEKRKDWHWVLIGEIGEGDPKTSIERLNLPNIHLLGAKSYALLPDYLRAFDVVTIPAAINGYTAKMFPMKFFEYLAAGKPVVATDIPSIREYKDAYAAVGSRDEFILAIENILKGNRPSEEICLNLAKSHTWGKRIDKMIELMEKGLNQK